MPAVADFRMFSAIAGETAHFNASRARSPSPNRKPKVPLHVTGHLSQTPGFRGFVSPSNSRPTFAAAVVSMALWLYLVVSAVVLGALFFPIVVLTLPFDRQRRMAASAPMVWASLLDRISPLWTMTVRGRENLVAGRPYIYVANHQSSLDIILLLALRLEFKWISKTSNFWVPIAGWWMWLAGYVPISRGDRDSRNRMLEICTQRLAQGSSIAIFPEGTRNENENLSTFKRGAFVLAAKTGAEIVPIVIHGVRELLPRNALVVRRLRRCYAHVEILPPISPREFHNDPKTMAAAVQDKMQDTLTILRDRTLSQPAPDIRGHVAH
jgi:1-acyl-sn-glycerol-3-phosphate acyltransferase